MKPTEPDPAVVALVSDVSCLITIADTMTSNREGTVRGYSASIRAQLDRLVRLNRTLPTSVLAEDREDVEDFDKRRTAQA